MSAAAQGAAIAERRQIRLPPSETFLARGALVDLAKKLEALKESTRDVVADTRDVGMTEDGALVVRTNGEPYAYPLSRHAHSQLAEKTGIPFRYYDRMFEAGQGRLAATNVNTWLQSEPERRLVRVADGRVRAILSDRYRVLDNYDLALLTADRALQHGAEVLECSLTETRMSVKITLPNAREKIGELTRQVRAAHANDHWVRRGSVMDLDADYVVPGLMVSNSEVGSAAFRVEPFALRLVCWNGLIAEQTLSRVHLGSRLEAGEVVYSDATRKLDDQALWAKVGDVIDSTFNPDSFRAMLGNLRASTEIEIRKPVEVTDAVARNLALTQEKKELLLRYFTVEGHTLYGLVNGVTRLAQDEQDPDAQIELERAAGELLAHPVPALALS